MLSAISTFFITSTYILCSLLCVVLVYTHYFVAVVLWAWIAKNGDTVVKVGAVELMRQALILRFPVAHSFECCSVAVCMGMFALDVSFTIISAHLKL
jgi:hypothetical protein